MKLETARPPARSIPTALDAESVKRIQWLFERACRHGFGAEPSLRLAVEAGAIRMARDGASIQAIRAAVAGCVSGASSDGEFRPPLVGESRVAALRKRVVQWVNASRHIVPFASQS